METHRFFIPSSSRSSSSTAKDFDLRDLMIKCRCCLQETRFGGYVELSNFIEEKFYEFTSLRVSFWYIWCNPSNWFICIVALSFVAPFIKNLPFMQLTPLELFNSQAKLQWQPTQSVKDASRNRNSEAWNRRAIDHLRIISIATRNQTWVVCWRSLRSEYEWRALFWQWRRISRWQWR